MGRYRKESSLETAELDNDGLALWEKVAQSVKKSKPQETFQSAKSKIKPKIALKAETRTDNLQPAQIDPAKANKGSAETEPADFRIGKKSGIDRSSARRLQRGQIQIEDKLDLHGLSQQQAHKRLVSFITQAVQLNFRNVLIITGKGREGHGVLRRQVPIWLKDAPLLQYINAISYAQPHDGGTGALYIRLRRQRRET